jgi:hypothetical protein
MKKNLGRSSHLSKVQQIELFCSLPLPLASLFSQARPYLLFVVIVPIILYLFLSAIHSSSRRRPTLKIRQIRIDVHRAALSPSTPVSSSRLLGPATFLTTLLVLRRFGFDLLGAEFWKDHAHARHEREITGHVREA